MTDILYWLSNNATIIGLVLSTVVAFVFTIVRTTTDYFERRMARERVLKAENEAFKIGPETFARKTEELRASEESLEQQAKDLNLVIQKSQAALQVGNLFDLYSKQIEKYQTETQGRASWSFIFAVFAMLAGLGFVVWAGVHVLTNPGWEHVAAATGIAAIGGAVGGYITKTFLDVHRLSLSQLNHYFRQPVLNAHVLTAQRLAESIVDPPARQLAYERILGSVVNLIRDELYPGAVWTAEPPPPKLVVQTEGRSSEHLTQNASAGNAA